MAKLEISKLEGWMSTTQAKPDHHPANLKKGLRWRCPLLSDDLKVHVLHGSN